MNPLLIGEKRNAIAESLKVLIQHYHRLSKIHDIGSEAWFAIMIKINDLQLRILDLCGEDYPIKVSQ